MSKPRWTMSLDPIESTPWRSFLQEGFDVGVLSEGVAPLTALLLEYVPESMRGLIGTAKSVEQSMTRYLRNREAALKAASAKKVGGEHEASVSHVSDRHAHDSAKHEPEPALVDVSPLIDLDGVFFHWGFSDNLLVAGGMSATRDQLTRGVKAAEVLAAFGQFEFAKESYRKGKWNDCLEGLQKAIEGNPTNKTHGHPNEWRFHFLRGMVWMGSFVDRDGSHVDLEAAEKAFNAVADLTRKSEPASAAMALLAAGWCAALARDEDGYKRALAATDESMRLSPSLTEAVFQAAKLRIALDRVDEAWPFIQRVANLEPLQLVKFFVDPDFQRHFAQLDPMLRKMREELADRARVLVLPIVDRLRLIMAESERLTQDPVARRVMFCAENLSTAGLIDLWGYVPGGLAEDEKALEEMRILLRRVSLEAWEETIVEKVPTGETRQVPTGEIERIPTGEMEEYEEQAPEQYEVEEIVQKANPLLFRKEKREKVVKTRMVTVNRTRERIQERPVMREEEIVEEVTRVVKHADKENVTWLIASGVEILSELIGGPVSIHAGNFIMGGMSTDVETAEEEKPHHEVILTHPFELWSAPVTQELYEVLMGHNPSYFKRGGVYPVEYVTYYDAVAFCNALSRSSGLPEAYVIDDTNVKWHGLSHPGWRLPTEAEWEYACRAGSTLSMYGELDDIAWHEGNAGKCTHPVCEKTPNGWGLYDMLGNVWEWVWDWKGDYGHHAVVDPTGPETGATRVFRGGSWSHVTRRPRTAVRNHIGPGFRYSYLGFRPARTVPRPKFDL